jgi:hypothetical protein
MLFWERGGARSDMLWEPLTGGVVIVAIEDSTAVALTDELDQRAADTVAARFDAARDQSVTNGGGPG